MRIIVLVFFFLGYHLSGLGQDFKFFELLSNKGDSAYRAKNYRLSAAYYNQADQLPENQKPEIGGRLYYDMACVYALLGEIDSAFLFLNKSFVASNTKRKKNPVSAIHLLSDKDLDLICGEPQFFNLLKHYYPQLNAQKAFELVRSKELSYTALINYSQIFEKETGDEKITIRNKIIYWEKSDSNYLFNKQNLPLADSRAFKSRTIEFVNCTFKLNFVWSNMEETNPPGSSYYNLNFTKCRFEGRFFFWNIEFTLPSVFSDCIFKDGFVLFINIDRASSDKFYNSFSLEKNTFDHDVWIHIESNDPLYFKLIDNVFKGSDVNFQAPSVISGQLLGNKMEQGFLTLIIQSAKNLRLADNQLSNLIMNRTTIDGEFDLQNTTLNGKFLLNLSYFSEAPVNDIDWNTISDLRLAHISNYSTTSQLDRSQGRIKIESRTYDITSGEKDEDFSDPQKFRELMGLYSMFLNLYKNKNDIESYNGCFVTIKELRSRRLQYLYESNKSFEAYFSWKLSQLLKFYVHHGTNPARAIVISLYIIFWFGIFFFFFPSDWDVTSKKRLFQNFKDFIQKNEKGYIVPFFVLLGGFAISLINALTLSLNAFITLGFGNIPTHGLARYVCVIEGFLGWFLLSIFTVALINQVL